jgi:tagaturonate epimerase
LDLAKEIYAKALMKKEELCAPYATVIDIDSARLPSAETVKGWTGEQFVSVLRHEPSNPSFNPSLRQLVHVGFKIAAMMGEQYLKMLKTCERSISRNVTGNLYDRHLKPLFVER